MQNENIALREEIDKTSMFEELNFIPPAGVGKVASAAKTDVVIGQRLLFGIGCTD